MRMLFVLIALNSCALSWYLANRLVSSHFSFQESATVDRAAQDSTIKEMKWMLMGQGMYLRSHLDKKHQHEMDQYFRKHKLNKGGK